MPRSIVLVSGGHHSAATLLLARQAHPDVQTVHIANDRHGAEGFFAARRFAEAVGVSFAMIPAHHYGRGYLADMLRQAAGLATLEGVSDVYAGVWDLDGNTRAYLEATQAAERERTGNHALTFHVPMLGAAPDLPFGVASSFGLLDTLTAHTHPCERPTRTKCGKCAPCLRWAAGWDRYTTTEIVA